ncbi:MAG: dienelactone hydrolase family protein [Litoreibacter sp.]
MIRLFLFLLGFYFLYAIVMVAAHPRFLYPFGPDKFDARGWRKEFIPNQTIAMAISEGSDRVAILFFMGNGGALAYYSPMLSAHQNAGRTIAAMEYPGGGGIPGEPSERQLKADALVAYDWLATHHDGPVAVHGYSLGTGIAQHVAAKREVAAIILDAPYVKMCELMTRRAFLPACYLPGVQTWNSAALVPQLSAPILIQLGTDDQLIPISDGQRLTHLMTTAGLNVTFHEVSRTAHNNLAHHPRYQDRIEGFLGALSLKNPESVSAD